MLRSARTGLKPGTGKAYFEHEVQVIHRCVGTAIKMGNIYLRRTERVPAENL